MGRPPGRTGTGGQAGAFSPARSRSSSAWKVTRSVAAGRLGAPSAALTGGFQLALWVCGLTGLAAIPVAFMLIRAASRPRMATARAHG